MEEDLALRPFGVRLLCAEAVMFQTDSVAEDVHEAGLFRFDSGGVFACV